MEKPTLPGPGGTPPAKAQHLLQQVLDRFYPRHYRNGAPPEQLRWAGGNLWGSLGAVMKTGRHFTSMSFYRHLADMMATKWAALQGCSPPECIRIYLTVARKWPLFGAKLFAAQVSDRKRNYPDPQMLFSLEFLSPLSGHKPIGPVCSPLLLTVSLSISDQTLVHS